MNKTFRLIVLGLFVAQSLVLYIVEGMLPVPFIAPGAKLGLANLITVIALYSLPRKRDVFLILLLRVVLSTAFGGGINAFVYSAAGAGTSLSIMIICKERKIQPHQRRFYSRGEYFPQFRQVLVAQCRREYQDSPLPVVPACSRHRDMSILIGLTAYLH